MPIDAFSRLRVYALAAELGDEIRDVAQSWSSFDRWTTGVQVVRAADSVGANIAEASGRWHYADRRRFLFVARGSLAETLHWTLRAKKRGLDVPVNVEKRIDEVARLLNGLIRSTRK